MSNPDPSNGATVASLPPAAIALATRMYDAARNGDMEIFNQALSLGLPANMTNEKGDSLVSLGFHQDVFMVLSSATLDKSRSPLIT